jgi:hypothetical protein
MSGPDDRVEQILAELGGMHDPHADQELEALKIAVLLEDSLGVVLADDDLHRLHQEGPSAAGAILDRIRQERA